MKTEEPKDRAEIYGEDTAETAFQNADKHALGDLKLQPYTLERQWAAEAMQLKYGFVDDAGMEFFKKHKIYPGASRDVAIVLWLCSLPDDSPEIGEAYRNPNQAITKASVWAIEHGLGKTRGEDFWQAYALFMAIMNELDASRSVPVETSNEGPPPDPKP